MQKYLTSGLSEQSEASFVRFKDLVLSIICNAWGRKKLSANQKQINRLGISLFSLIYIKPNNKVF